MLCSLSCTEDIYLSINLESPKIVKQNFEGGVFRLLAPNMFIRDTKNAPGYYNENRDKYINKRISFRIRPNRHVLYIHIHISHVYSCY